MSKTFTMRDIINITLNESEAKKEAEKKPAVYTPRPFPAHYSSTDRSDYLSGYYDGQWGKGYDKKMEKYSTPYKKGYEDGREDQK